MKTKLKQFLTFSVIILTMDFIYNVLIKTREIFEPPAYKYIDFILFYVAGMLIAYLIIYINSKIKK